MGRELVDKWLAAVGDFRLNERGVCVLESDQGSTLIVEVLQDAGDKVFFSAPIAPVGDTESESLFRFVLELNLSLLHSGGLTFALDSFSGTLLLGLAKDIEELDEVVFLNILSNVAILAQEFSVAVAEYLMEEDDQAVSPSRTSTDLPAGMVRI